MTVACISGNFDPLHVGHLRHIQDAMGKCDNLIVILSRNDQCIEKKGIVLFDYKERKELIEGYLRETDRVEVNMDKDLTCAVSLTYFNPDIFFKGGDRSSLEALPKNEIEVCKNNNIKIVFG